MDAEQKRLREKEHALAVEKHKRLFKCHICGQQSAGPYLNSGMPWYDDDSGQIISYGPPYYEWDRPTGLSKCEICGQWVDEKHIEKGICEKCAEMGYLPGDIPKWWDLRISLRKFINYLLFGNTAAICCHLASISCKSGFSALKRTVVRTLSSSGTLDDATPIRSAICHFHRDCVSHLRFDFIVKQPQRRLFVCGRSFLSNSL